MKKRVVEGGGAGGGREMKWIGTMEEGEKW